MSGGGEHLKDEGTRQQVVVAGAIAGLVSRFCIAPLDVVKIRLQLQTHPPCNFLPGQNHPGPIYRGTFPTFQAILQEEGLTAFWKGNIPAELLYILYGSLQFSIYRSTTLALHTLAHPLQPPTYIESFISGALAGAAATTLTYPLDLLRTRFAAQGREKVYQSLFGGIRDIWRHEGPAGFFQGIGAGVGQVVPYMGLFFSTYEALRAPLSTLSLPFGSGDATAGVLASITAKTGTFPLDLIRKRLQVQGPTRGRYVNGGYMELYERGVWDTGRRIVAREGWRGLYRGLGVGLVKAAPASAVTMWTYERALREMKRWEVLD